VACAVALGWVLRRENARRDRAVEEVGGVVDEAERDKLAFLDLTDKENPYFRYVY
jgi:hypothetical protein